MCDVGHVIYMPEFSLSRLLLLLVRKAGNFEHAKGCNLNKEEMENFTSLPTE
jgi:hypothetical protein